MGREVAPLVACSGEIRVPGDKSIAHRALILGAVADGESRVGGFPDGADVASTGEVLRRLGVAIEFEGSVASVAGVGLRGLEPPSQGLDCGNSGTTMRLMAGLLAGAGVPATLTGDRSLRRRPMERVVEPLRAMGALVGCRPGGRPPLEVAGGKVRAVTYRTPVPSAQIKSCVLLAGLYADAETCVIEASRSRDHTERMLAAMGIAVRVQDGGPTRICLTPGDRLAPLRGELPGDVSSAAFWVGLAASVEGAWFFLPGVGVNPSRRAILDRLEDWGAAIGIENRRLSLGEPLADLSVRSTGRLTGGVIEAREVPGLIDELPLLAALAPLTEEGIEVRGASELRVKESDRIDACCAALRAVGIAVDEFPDGFAVEGRQDPRPGEIDARGDHRIAMAFAVLGAARAGVTIRGWQAAAVSYPGFFDQLDRLR